MRDTMPRQWHEASKLELVKRLAWLEAQLGLGLALLAVRDHTPISRDFIDRTQTIRKAGPDDPEWQQRHETAH